MNRQKYLCVLIVTAGILLPGCSEQQTLVINDPDLEMVEGALGVPEGWQFEALSGQYETALTTNSYQGQTALVLAGSGGTAELKTNEFSLTPSQLFECDLHIQTQDFSDGKAEIGVLTQSSPGGEPEFRKVYTVSEDKPEWTRVALMFQADPNAESTTNRLVFRMIGEGLMRLDSLQPRVSRIFADCTIPDGGFETPNVDRTFPGWNTSSSTGIMQAVADSTSPYRGQNCLHIEGSGVWCVCTSSVEVPSVATVTVQAYVRSRSGSGQIKIEYFAGGSNIGHNHTDVQPDEDWQLLKLRSDPILQEQADVIRVSLAAVSDTGEISVDFDEVQMYARLSE